MRDGRSLISLSMNLFGTYYYPLIVAIVMLLPGAAVGVFISWAWPIVKDRLAQRIPEHLRELSTQYECAAWIVDTKARVDQKTQIYDWMCKSIEDCRVSKRGLLAGGSLWRYMALAAAITVNPQKEH